MTAKEYLNQAYRLEHFINLEKEEIEYWQQLAISISSPGFEEHYNATRSTDAPFVKTVYKIMEYQDRVNERLNKLLVLKEQITDVINRLEDSDERVVLQYRYLKNYSWSRIGDLMIADERTVRRWHNRALAHVVLPENPIVL
jgi:DNA-directed RNA polymerase specialized sigma subunit